MDIVCTAQDIAAVKEKDARLALEACDIDTLIRQGNSNVFCAVIESIISQQLSGKIADIICSRFYEKFPNPTPDNLAAIPEEEIKSVGISLKKAQYIKGAAEAGASGGIDYEGLKNLSDADIIERLTALKGIGVWTAEMLLIFSLNRCDVFSVGDYAIKRVAKYLHGDNVDLSALKKLYSPFGTAASLLYWEIAGRIK